MSSAIPTPSTTHPSTATAPTQRRRTLLAAAVGTAAGIGLFVGGLSPAAAHAAEATTASGTVAQQSAEQAAERTYSSLVPAGSGAPTSSFGEPRGKGTHLGTDYGVATGTPITAVTDGEVLRVETGKKVGDKSPSSALKGHTGNGVVVKHGDIGGDEMYSYYGHLSAVDVKPGDKVKAGTVVGKAGNTGNSTGPHLHFGVFLNADEPGGKKWTKSTNTGFIDPHDWLKRKGVNAGADAPVTP